VALSRQRAALQRPNRPDLEVVTQAARTDRRRTGSIKDPDGKTSLFVDADEAQTDGLDFAGVTAGRRISSKQPRSRGLPADRKIKYRNRCGLQEDTSPTPKKDSMGMDTSRLEGD